MTYIDLINAFEKWLETNYLPSLAQLLWYKLIVLFNKAGWSEWVIVDNRRLMSITQIDSEKTLIRNRDKLIESNLFEFQKGKKGSPNKYKINTVNFTVQTTVKTTVNMGVKTTVKTTANMSNINRIRQDSYINIYNIYKSKIENAKYYGEKVGIISELKKSEEYENLSDEEKERIFIDLMNVK